MVSIKHIATASIATSTTTNAMTAASLMMKSRVMAGGVKGLQLRRMRQVPQRQVQTSPVG